MKDVFMKEVGRATSHLFKKNDSKTRDARLRSAFNATQCTGIHKKECTKLSVNRQDKNKCTGNYCCRIEQCIRHSGLCLRRRRGCQGRRLFFFFFFESGFTISVCCNKPFAFSFFEPLFANVFVQC